MKGYGIEIKNNLLEPKHLQNMGIAIWLYMWMIDKMTSVGEDGIGKILGGKPIKYQEIKEELNINRITYVRWVAVLRKSGYINVLRTPCGIVFTVNKAFKRFNRRCDKNDTAMLQKRTCNIRQYNDTNNKDTRNSTNCAILYKKKADNSKLEEVGGSRNSKVVKNKLPLPRVGKDKVAQSLQKEFQDMAKKILRADVGASRAGYYSVLRVMNQQKMSPEQIKTLFKYWFETAKDDYVTSITACLSIINVERYKFQHGITSK